MNQQLRHLKVTCVHVHWHDVWLPTWGVSCHL